MQNRTFFRMLLIWTIGLMFVSILNSCSDSNTNGPDDDNGGSIYFLMCHYHGGELGAKDGLVLVSSTGTVSWVSDYYPSGMTTDNVDIKNGRIAFYCQNPPEGGSQIAYMDVNDLENVKFIPVPKSNDEDFYWQVNNVRPQVMSDGRIIIKVTYETVNEYDDFHQGQLAIYDPKTNDFVMSGSLDNFILSQPEKGNDTEAGSMGASFALSPDDKFVCFDAYGFGTDMGQYHEDYEFIVKWDIAGKKYSRVTQGNSPTVLFVSSDNNYVVANVNGKKYRFDAHNDNAEGYLLDEYTDFICVGQHSLKGGNFFKVWRGSGLSLFDLNTGWLYNPIIGDSLKAPYRGLGSGGQFSPDEKYIYFTASTDFYTNYRSEFLVMRTPSDYGKTDSNPDSLFVMKPEYDRRMFLLITK